MVQQPFAFAAFVRFIASARRHPQSEAEASSFTAESFVGEDLANVAALGCLALNFGLAGYSVKDLLCNTDSGESERERGVNPVRGCPHFSWLCGSREREREREREGGRERERERERECVCVSPEPFWLNLLQLPPGVWRGCRWTKKGS